MRQKAKILIFCMIFVGGGAFGQKVSVLSFLKNDEPPQPAVIYAPDYSTFSCWLGGYQYKLQLNPAYLKNAVINKSVINLVSPSFTISNYSFFCKQEYKLEKSTGIPFRFRLGSLQQCDYLEGKR